MLKRFQDILALVSCRGFAFNVALDGERAYMQVTFVADDACAEGVRHWGGRKWFLSSHMTQSEVVQTALKAVLTAVEHEARENFRYRGQAIFHPHWDVDLLYKMCETLKGLRDYRAKHDIPSLPQTRRAP